MRITLVCAGSRGDVQPYVALAEGLQAAGHDITVATHRLFEPMVRAHGLAFAPVEGNPQAVLESEVGQSWLESANALAFARGFRDIMADAMRAGLKQTLEVAGDTELFIAGGPAFYMVYNVAEKLKRPLLQAYLQPLHPTRDFPSALMMPPITDGPLARGLNLASHYLTGMLFWRFIGPVMDEARRTYLDLPPSGFMGPFARMERERWPVLYGFSPSALPPPRDWGDWIHVTGYWFLDEPAYTPPPELADFVTAGPKPVYIGFGSMRSRDPKRLTATVLEAVEAAGVRAVLLSGWAGLGQGGSSERVYVVDSVPHSWLFPRMAAVVHHGGAGTTAAGLRAGVPSLITPFFADQPFWGRVVHRLGVGPRPLSVHSLRAEDLAAALGAMITDEQMEARAAALGERVKAEDGVGAAVKVIENMSREDAKARRKTNIGSL